MPNVYIYGFLLMKLNKIFLDTEDTNIKRDFTKNQIFDLKSNLELI